MDLSSFSTILPRSTLGGSFRFPAPASSDLLLSLPDLVLLLEEPDLPRSTSCKPAFGAELSSDSAVSMIATSGADDLLIFLGISPVAACNWESVSELRLEFLVDWVCCKQFILQLEDADVMARTIWLYDVALLIAWKISMDLDKSELI